MVSPLQAASSVLLSPDSNTPSGSRPVEAARDASLATVYIGGVAAHNTENDVKQHIVSLGVPCSSVQVLSRKGDWRTFKAEISPNYSDTVCNSEKWPTGVKVRPFRPSSEKRYSYRRPQYRQRQSISSQSDNRDCSRRWHRQHTSSKYGSRSYRGWGLDDQGPQSEPQRHNHWKHDDRRPTSWSHR